MCRVLNKLQTGVPSDALNIGRGSKWGNPFRTALDGVRAAVIGKYERWLRDQRHLLRALDELRARDLICFRAPRACQAISCGGSPMPAATNASPGGPVSSSATRQHVCSSAVPRSARRGPRS
jgi:hypothetical protein